MRRLKKTTPLSIALTVISSLLLILLFYTGNLYVGAGAVLFFVLGIVARKPESYNEYRARYDEKYDAGGESRRR